MTARRKTRRCFGRPMAAFKTDKPELKTLSPGWAFGPCNFSLVLASCRPWAAIVTISLRKPSYNDERHFHIAVIAQTRRPPLDSQAHCETERGAHRTASTSTEYGNLTGRRPPSTEGFKSCGRLSNKERDILIRFVHGLHLALKNFLHL